MFLIFSSQIPAKLVVFLPLSARLDRPPARRARGRFPPGCVLRPPAGAVCEPLQVRPGSVSVSHNWAARRGGGEFSEEAEVKPRGCRKRWWLCYGAAPVMGRTLQVKCIFWPWAPNVCRAGAWSCVRPLRVLLEKADGPDPFLVHRQCSAVPSCPHGAAVCKLCSATVRCSRSVHFIAWGRWICVCVLFWGSLFFFFSFKSYFLFLFTGSVLLDTLTKHLVFQEPTFKRLRQAEVLLGLVLHLGTPVYTNSGKLFLRVVSVM